MGSGMVPVDGGQLWYEEAGAGPPIVLLHEGILDSRMFDPQFRVFTERFRTVRYDFRGYGRSPRAERPYSEVEDLRAVLDDREIDQAALVGLSMGGSIALEFVLSYPDLVRALVLGAPGLRGYDDDSPELTTAYEAVEAVLGRGDVRQAAELELAIWARSPTDDSTNARIFEIAMDNADQVTLDYTLRVWNETPAIERLGEIRVPTLVLIGDEDVPDMLTIADLISSSIPGARKHVITGADHVLNMRAPEEFNRVVLEFLS